jgi:hypothetical protein
LVRSLVAAALLFTWLLPITRLSVLPQQRAEELAIDTICRARWDSAPLRNGIPDAASTVLPTTLAGDPRIADIAKLFEPAMARAWRTELAQAAFAVLALAALLAGWRWAPALAIAAAILYLQQHALDWDGYRLLAVTESVRLWWVAIRQWSAALWAERLIAPVTVWAALLGSCCMSLRAAWVHRGDAAAWSGRLFMRRPFANPQ